MKKPAQGGLEVVEVVRYAPGGYTIRELLMRYERAWDTHPITMPTSVAMVRMLAERASIAAIESEMGDWPIPASTIRLERPILCDLMEAAQGRIHPAAESRFREMDEVLRETGVKLQSYFNCDPHLLVYLIHAAAPVLFPDAREFKPASPESQP